MKRLALATLAAWAWFAATLPAATASEAVDALLFQGSRAELRARLMAHAASAADSAERGEAWYHAGMSYQHAGLADSAIRCYERAVALRGGGPDLEAYADALTLRGSKTDAARAIEALRPRMDMARRSTEHEIADTGGRLGWAWYVAGRGDSALIYMRLHERRLLDVVNPLRRLWRYRMGVVEMEHGDAYRAIETLSWLAVESRFQDREVIDLLRTLSDRTRIRANVERTLKVRRAELDEVDQIVVDTLGGRRVTFPGSDGFPLAGVALPAKSPRSRAVVMLVPPEDPLEAFDTLAVGMRRAGYSVMLLDVRGSGHSVAPSCALPEAWMGREDLMIETCATDVAPALTALAGAARVDTTAYLVVGVGSTGPIAAAAAARDRRVRALVLVGPAPMPDHRGVMRAHLQAFGRPVFFEVPAENRATQPVAEGLYQATDMRASRISESERPGEGARVFRYDPPALPRLLRWIDESWGSAPRGRKR